VSLLTLLLPSLVPVFADSVRGLIGKFTGTAGAQPQNVSEAIALMQAQSERLRALAQLDTPPGQMSQWVADLRGSFRYLAVGGIVVATLGAVFTGVDAAALAVLLELTGASMSFIIGERMYLGLKK
jgi:hypothetical protein